MLEFILSQLQGGYSALRIVHQHRKDSFGRPVTYVYEEHGYWDKDTKKYISKRKIIGKIDESTGEIIPTGKAGRPRKQTFPQENTKSVTEPSDDSYKELYLQLLQNSLVADAQITRLTQQNVILQQTLDRYQKFVSSLRDGLALLEV